ncbi:hypothetical protein BZM27_52265 [Paraburkholderia steynii]|uniref:Acyl-CoA dehydrogenase/oxidase N-terminal domain-containing protein n=1 Tax=Paraburkholderia steynii TaxID=1245441 RepID=A0A4R0WZE4_9BURK|nr:hypothetical protein BZM27_52265 [Paraburkholderia steynii]
MRKQSSVYQSIAIVAKKNALEAETLRRMPEENVKAIRESGLMPLLRPREFGGFEADWITHIDCCAEVARSAARQAGACLFCFNISFTSDISPSRLSRRFTTSIPIQTSRRRSVPIGKIKRVSGGFEVSGRWVFASGVDHCDWAIVGGKVGIGGKVGVGNFLLSPGQFTVDRVWNSAGLKGSGSNDYRRQGPSLCP